jgi:hypothetical protein
MTRVVRQAYFLPVFELSRYDFVTNRVGGVRPVAGGLWIS